MIDDITSLRARIDALDAELLQLMNARATVAKAIGELKNNAAYRPEREAQVLRRVQELNSGPLPNEAVALLFRELMSACLASGAGAGASAAASRDVDELRVDLLVGVLVQDAAGGLAQYGSAGESRLTSKAWRTTGSGWWRWK